MWLLKIRKSTGQRQSHFEFKNPRLGQLLRINPVMLHWQWLGAHVAAQKQEVHWSETIPFGLKNPRLDELLRIDPVMLHWQWLGVLGGA